MFGFQLQMAQSNPWSKYTEQQLFTKMKRLDSKILSLEKEVKEAEKQYFLHERGLKEGEISPLLIPYPKNKYELADRMKIESVKIFKLREVYFSVSDAWWEKAIN